MKRHLTVALCALITSSSLPVVAQTQAEMDAVSKILKEPQTKTSTLQLKDSPNHSKDDEIMAYIGLAEAQAREGNIAAAEMNLTVADKQIFDFVAKDKTEFSRREMLSRLYYLAKASVAKAKGDSVRYKEFMELV